jgi:hypothetical protein
MGSYAYCSKCGGALNKPTAREALDPHTSWECALGHQNDPSYMVSAADYIIELEERLAVIEERLGVTPNTD